MKAGGEFWKSKETMNSFLITKPNFRRYRNMWQIQD